MPAVGAWLASAAFTIGTTAVTWGTILKTAFVIGAAARANSQRKKARRAMLDSIQDRTIMVRSAVADCPIVYGRARVSGPFRPVGTSGTNGARFSFTVSLAGAIDAIEDIWFNDESIGALDGSGWVTGGRYAKTRQEYATKVVTSLPGSGIITLDHTPDSVASVAVDTGTDNGYESVAFSVAGNQVTISSAYAGKWVNVTYYHTVTWALARAKGYLGQAGQAADPYLLSEFPSTWTSSHRSDGASYLACTLLYDQDVFTSGIPNVSAIVRGRRVYDPRLDSTNGGSGSHRYTDPTTWAWSRNPALIARDYLKMELGCDDSEIDDTTVIAAANACDEWVQVSPSMTEGDFFESGGIKYQLRYTFDGALSSQADRLSNLESILMAMVGSAVYSAGKWELQAGVWEAPTTLALDDDDLAGGQVVVQARQARRDLINGVRGNYMHPDKWLLDDFPPYTSSTFVTEDGGAVSIRQIDLPMIRCPYRAQRVAKLMMFQSRQALTMTATWNLGAYEITPTKMVDLTIGRYGWTGKDFKCMNRVYDPMGGVELSFKEEAAAIYEWDYNDAIDPDPAPNTTLPDPRSVTTPTGFALSSVIRRRSDGVWTIGIKATWDESTDVGVLRGGSFEIQLRNAFTGAIITTRVSGDSTEAIIAEAVNDGDIYHAGIRASNGVASSAWAYLSGYTVTGPTDAPNPPTAYLATAESFGIRLTWTKSTSFDVVEYQLREGSTWDSATDIGTVAGNTFFWKPSTAGTKTFWIKAIDAWGNVSTAVQADVTTSVPAVTGLALSVDGDSALIVWGAPASNYELADYEIRVGATYAGSTLLGYSRTTVYRTRISGVGTVRYWVAARDVAGNVGASTGVDLIVSVPLTPVIGSEVVDNFVLLRWQDCKTTLPVERYEVYRGATLVGDNGDGRFAVLFEQVAGLYTYGVKAYDSAGNVSALGTVTVNVSAPPDYVLRDNFDSTFSGTLTNGYLIDGAIHAPMYVETDAAHTTRIGVSTDSAAAGLGYDKWWEPGQTSASYVETFDLGVTVDPSTITITPTLVEVQGTVTVTYSVKVSTTGAFAGEETTYSGQQVYAGTTFRYVRVTITFASTGGDDLVQVTALNVKVATKLRTEAGVVNVTANPTTVNTSGSIDEILAIALTPTGTAARTAVYSYTSGTSFDVYLFNSSGAAVTGQVAWTVRGV